MNNSERKKFEVDVSPKTTTYESAEGKTEALPEDLEARPLYETTGEYARFMEYAREDSEQDAIRSLRQIEGQGGISREDIEKTREETGVLGDLAEVQADAELLEAQMRENTEQNIFDTSRLGDLAPAKPDEKKKLLDTGQRRKKLRAEAHSALQSVFDTYEDPGRVEPYNPKRELKQVLRARGGERKELLQDWKIKFAAHRMNLAQAQEEIIEFIREDPDIFSDEDKRFVFLSEIFAKYKMPGYESGRMAESREFQTMAVLGRVYAEKHAAVHTFRQNHPDDQELFFAAFGTRPRGRVEVIEGPMTLYFRCDDEWDYALIHSKKFAKNQSIERGDIDRANMSGGVSIGSALVPELEGAIIAESTRGTPFEGYAKTTYVHEEQHAINRLFGTRWGRRKYGRSAFQELLHSERGSTREAALREYLRDLREDNLEHAKDEIIAYFKDGRNPQEIFDTLVRTFDERGNYDYFHQFFRGEEGNGGEKKYGENGTALQHSELYKVLAEKLGGSEEIPENMGEIMRDVFRREYRKMLGDAIGSYLGLRNRGLSNEHIAAIFLQEPLSKWLKTTDRLLESTGSVFNGQTVNQEVEGANGSAPILSADIGMWQALALKKKAGNKLSKKDLEQLEDIETRGSRELDSLIGPNCKPLQILTDKEMLRKEMEFLEKWNKLTDEEQIERMARSDQILRMESWDEHALRARENEIKTLRILDQSTSTIFQEMMAESPVTREEEETYNDLLKRDPNIFTFEMTTNFFTIQRRLRIEKARIIGLGGPEYGNRDMVTSRARTQAYYEFLKEWNGKSPQERENAFDRLGELEHLLDVNT